MSPNFCPNCGECLHPAHAGPYAPALYPRPAWWYLPYRFTDVTNATTSDAVPRRRPDGTHKAATGLTS